MTISEFKAWLEGFEEAMGEAPTAEQWQKIKDKLGTVRGAPVQGASPIQGGWGQLGIQDAYNQNQWREDFLRQQMAGTKALHGGKA